MRDTKERVKGFYQKYRLAREINEMIHQRNRELGESGEELSRLGLGSFFDTQKRGPVYSMALRHWAPESLLKLRAQLQAETCERREALDKLDWGRRQLRSLSSSMNRSYLLQLREVESRFRQQLG
ncbi:MAG: hypothetical protein RRB13_14765 [bacterium]|nr:hypothetical protein [bacterium]